MFLDMTVERNPDLIRTAALLHQSGAIPTNTYVLDVDAIYENAAAIREVADKYGATLYQMTKQHGRNPVAALAAEEAGIKGAVCVDVDEAIALASYGVTIGHVGHLQQIPDHSLAEILSYKPEVVTCFSVEKALRVGEEAARLGREQQVLFRVRATRDDQDDFHPAQEGGIRLSDLEQAVHALDGARGVRLVGVTTHPNLLYQADRREALPTKNLKTLLEAAEILRRCGVDVRQVNAPGVTCCATIPGMVQRGITHVEPGSALIGNTPLHSLLDQPEIPAMCYVTEVSHLVKDGALTIGYGFYPRSHLKEALVGSSPDELIGQRYPASAYPAEAIDYYGKLVVPPNMPMPKVGDSVVYAFRSQVFISNSFVAPLVGLRHGKPRLAGLWNAVGYPVDRQGRPQCLEEGEKFIQQAGFNSSIRL
ncbi:amino-acid racemase [Bacillus canaveralius]|uniref:Amino-acid racemase n=1 Tax=Bacillus canaveralius TaxID=1403243 RepID=A0A2N5GSC7_9BACI|nr:alanine racemase [Bacillus canaveralius]PLR86548.1 amino-acid racemase [Bacillus canaveralius]PLS00319.1 amino-acid racemase [Bacillus canaveralius]